MMRFHPLIFALALLSTAAMASSTYEGAISDNPVAEKRLQELSKELRCLVCQNETIADSNAELAVDLRREIRGMIGDGRSDREILDFMVTRYGDFVLYRPPVKTITLVLWAGPILMLLIGLLAMRSYLKRRSAQVADAGKPLSPDEARRADALLKELDNK
jgi:cytochrome c-type biogenesis protein CcmH